MDSIVLKSFGKINLGLDVVRRRPDGYHEVRMIMQTVGLCDTLVMKKTAGKAVTMRCDLSFLPTDRKNLVYQAVELMKEKYHISSGITVDLKKRIPVAAGMAGGSSNCAAAIKGMNELFGLNLSKEEMCEIGVLLGADVPYCIWGGTALAEGIGEKLTRIPPIPDCWILIAKPGISVSTAFAYKNLKLDQLERHPDIDGMIRDLEEQNLDGICSKLENVLETVTIPKHPIIRELKEHLLEHGAEGALMSGSGPTVFGIYKEKRTARKALESLRSIQDVKQAYVVEPV
ncbi:MAG TPA: 4-(cytidine 5'-diphospho)-2-C-methyl-D-erythritol kinase [Candidatus Anaerostipes avistercoris]|uniref:4-diphosphocytidyl-2-C-methyl-D-erythritol kinase n=1 Tax=Candidatus Anaerostipes avistercoris TaxID=2838462 RepID=A0A9D2PK59_9FIRM|nr:4-(cytidine 5'-diphospho)-2-C-methyl-D-erythritol kinase [uncultured Anaerostipes sp.]HJC50754.1 4-(cytidine 5'-diphospho)-2-C-methyl-D-erythritol kinase [Candidatus Anaerostipes avistercoris]